MTTAPSESFRLDRVGPTSFDGGELRSKAAAAGPRECGELYPEPGDVTCNPVSIRTGTKFKREIDFRAQGPMPLEMVRTYNSTASLSGLFGPYWSSSFDQRLVFGYTDGSACTVAPGSASCPVRPLAQISEILALKPDGGADYFTYDAGLARWRDTRYPESFAYLEKTAAGWSLHTDENHVEIYSETGVIQSKVDAYGTELAPGICTVR
ncbi:MAG: DUF6531 domain-containing protein [Panacagrimonas sp.]